VGWSGGLATTGRVSCFVDFFRPAYYITRYRRGGTVHELWEAAEQRAARGCVEKEKFMSVQERYDAARVVLQEHNQALGGPEATGYVDPEKFIQCVKAMGGTTEDRLRRMAAEDLIHCLPQPGNVRPMPLA